MSDGMLTPRDGEILTKAIRDALAPAPRPSRHRPPAWRIFARVGAQLAIAFTIAWCAWLFLGWLLTSYVALRVSAISTSPEALAHLSVGSPLSVGAQWHAQALTVRRITVLPSTGGIDLSLPIRANDCSSLATSGESCSGGILLNPALPLELSFSSPVTVDAGSSRVVSFDLDQQAPTDGSGGVALAVESAGQPVALSVLATTPTVLVVRSGDLASERLALHPRAGGLAPNERVHLQLQASARRGPPETDLLVEGVTALDTLSASGTSGEATGFAGKVVLFTSGTKVIDPATTISLSGSASSPIAVSFSLGPTAALQMTSLRATSVMTDEGELLPSRWADRPQFWGPIVTAIMGTLVLELTVGQGGVALKGLLDHISGTHAAGS